MENQPVQTKRRGLPRWAIALIIGGGCLFLLMILAIPAAIMLPVFSRARESAKRSSCQTNLRTLAQGMLMYANDYNGTYPCAPKGISNNSFETGASSPVSDAGSSGVYVSEVEYTPEPAPVGYGLAGTWVSAIRPYVGRNQSSIFSCPSDRAAQGSGCSYYYKHAINLAGKARFGQGEFSYPTDQVVLYERAPFHYGGGPIVDGSRLNAAFLDTHVKLVDMIDVAADGEPRYFNTIDTSSPKAAKIKKPYWDPRYCSDRF